MKTYYHNRLPHIAPLGATFFITFRLADSLPQSIVRRMISQLESRIEKLKTEQPKGYQKEIIRQRKLIFKQYEDQLDINPYGECHLKNEAVVKIIKEKLHEYDGDKYKLICYCIMPNHIHLLFDTSIQLVNETEFLPDGTPQNYMQLDKIMKRIKGASAVTANRILKRKGTFWQKDSYDHYVRNEKEYLRILFYILNNPVKAGLVEKWEDFQNTYIASQIQTKLFE